MIFLNLVCFSFLLFFSLSLSALHSDSARLKTNFATPHSFSPSSLMALVFLGLGWISTVMAVVRSFTITSIDYNVLHIRRHAPMPTLLHAFSILNETPLFIDRFVNECQRSDTTASFAPKSRPRPDRSCQR